MKYIEKHPIVMIVLGVIGIALSSIFVKYSDAPSTVTALWRLLWTVALMTPVVMGKKTARRELFHAGKKCVVLSCLSGLFLALHFATWFESLKHTSVASSTSIVCTEVIWVALGYCLFMKGRISGKAIVTIGVTFAGSLMIAWSDSITGGAHLYGDILALIAAVVVAVYTLLGREVRKYASTTVYTYLVYTSCACTLLIFCMLQGYGLQESTPSAVIVGLLLAVFSTIMGHSVFSWCLKYFSPSFVSASKLCEPVVAAIFAGFLFREMPSLLQILGGVVIIAGVYYYSRLERGKS